MRVIELSNGFEPVQFTNETLVIMAHQNKVIILNDSEEMWKIKRCLEVIEDGIKGKNDEDYIKRDTLTCFVDQFEEESYFLRERHIEPRNLKLEYVNNIDESKWDSCISFYFGYLNSADTFLSPNEYKIIADELKNFALTSGRCKPETTELLVQFSDILLGEYTAFENEKELFKARVIE